MDLLTSVISGLGALAIVAAGAAFYYARRADHLRAVSASAYQLAGCILLDEEIEERELTAAEGLLLDVLSDPEGNEAVALVNMTPTMTYVAVQKKARVLADMDRVFGK